MANLSPPNDVHLLKPSSRDAALDRAMRYIESNLDRAVRIEEVAAAAFVSRFYLARLFQASLGTTPTAYIRRARIELASRELRQGRQPMAQIAAQFGFFDQSHFVRCFRREMGCTPARYSARST